MVGIISNYFSIPFSVSPPYPSGPQVISKLKKQAKLNLA
jgi:hypothetical protein